MEENGTVGLFKNDAGIIYFNIRKGDTGIPLDNILPPEMLGDGFADAPLSDYINQLYIWLCSAKRWNQAYNKIRPALEAARKTGEGVSFKPPTFDLNDLKLKTANGEVDYARLAALAQLVAPYWNKTPQIGLIVEMIRQDLSLEYMSELLAFYDRCNGNIPDIDKCFMQIFIDPNLDNTSQSANKDDIEYALSWCRRPDGTGELKQENLYWNLNLRELGIINSDGQINQTIARKVSNFIWSDKTREPDYFALRDHLDIHASKPKSVSNQKSVPKAYRDKLKKRKRKQGRINRSK